MTITDTALDTAQDLITRVAERIGSDAIHVSVNPVETEHVPGFIPYTDGGWDAVVTFDFYSEVSYATALISPDLDRDYVHCQEEFRREHDLAEDAEVHEHEAWEDWQTDWEHGDPSDWYVKVRGLLYRQGHARNESGEDEMLFCLGVNNDYTYGRDSISWCPGVGTTWIWERNVPLAELTPELAAEMEAEMLAAWSAA